MTNLQRTLLLGLALLGSGTFAPVFSPGGGAGGSGTVTSVDATGGVETASGSAITTSGSVRGAECVNVQSGISYTVDTSDRGCLVTFSNAASIAVTLPQAGGGFPNKWWFEVQNRGAGEVTITPSVSTVDGAASLVVAQNGGVRIVSNGANYFTQRGLGGSAAPTSYPYWGGGSSGQLSAEHDLSALGTGLVLNTTGTPSAYGGAACTNQVIEDLNASGSPTCRTITSAYVDTTIVTSVNATGGVETTTGSPITSTGTVRASNLVNAQTGVTYTVLTGDRGKLVTFTNASAIAVTLPQAGGTFPSGWSAYFENRGAGAVTITPTTSTIDGTTSVELGTHQGMFVASDGTNYFTMRGVGGAPTSATYITQTSSGSLTNEQALSALATGCLNVTTGTGVIASTGVACAGGNLGIVVVDAGNSPYTTQAGDQVLLCDTSAANRTINLITASGNNGVRYKIKNIGGGQCTIDGAGAETIDGGSTAVLTVQYEAIELVAQSTGARWHIF